MPNDIAPAKANGATNTALAAEIRRRRTFAIISHPDAGKTTLTEKLLLFGGAIQLAGQVKAKKDGRNTRSDWMAIERARGISVVTSVMTFEYEGAVFNLLDTPGHEDFSDHTYRTLTAVDSAIMVIDAAKGIEARTRKLFEVCRLRDIPIITFINKLDREAREPLELLDEIEKVLALDTAPMVWPIGKGRGFRGTFDLSTPRIRRIDEDPAGLPVSGPDDPIFETLLEPDELAAWREEIELVRDACGSFDLKAFREGALSPVYFGSALRNFGVRDLLDALIAYAPPPLSRKAARRTIEATEPAMTGIIFKIQANMDPNHRDRMAFMRLCSGRLTRGMKVKHVRTDKTMALTAPQFFFAQDRSLAEEAYAGDVVGIPNRGTLRIGDALTEGEDVQFLGIPSFAPEILRRIRLEDAIRAKKLKDALKEMAEEGVVQLFSPLDGTPPIVGVIGALQLDVLGDRLTHEYGLPIGFETAPCEVMRWIEADDPAKLNRFIEINRSSVAKDSEGDYVYMAPSVFSLNWVAERNPDIKFIDVKAVTQG
ncbi:MAG: peptide chain release factor 3 [Hyphomicrobium sp.]|uniref:peptide chain release factor 3 n=1 Tax=Hyphomicrobium sp. TaxID=82 RepID=UPI001325B08D|nr:peptide chain release factor 3 [Hyphomicrobium sp.]KAB2941261.1 MAG: peptide chain release factor 3 [Hyphomicrobium sp.]MBZ0209151.1 peptide chain release factor 3 [Hyphomicrobium sp.]